MTITKTETTSVTFSGTAGEIEGVRFAAQNAVENTAPGTLTEEQTTALQALQAALT